jgi:hypothetical protein
VGTLRTSSGHKLAPEVVLSIGHQLLDVLAAAHAHGDIKPANLFLMNDDRLKVLDFGIARIRDAARSHATQTGAMMGTPAFMAPEQASGRTAQVDALTDIWAVGATLFTLASGRLVHEAESGQAMIIQAATRQATSLASVLPGAPPVRRPNRRSCPCVRERSTLAKCGGEAGCHSRWERGSVWASSSGAIASWDHQRPFLSDACLGAGEQDPTANALASRSGSCAARPYDCATGIERGVAPIAPSGTMASRSAARGGRKRSGALCGGRACLPRWPTSERGANRCSDSLTAYGGAARSVTRDDGSSGHHLANRGRDRHATVASAKQATVRASLTAR